MLKESFEKNKKIKLVNFWPVFVTMARAPKMIFFRNGAWILLGVGLTYVDASERNSQLL